MLVTIGLIGLVLFLLLVLVILLFSPITSVESGSMKFAMYARKLHRVLLNSRVSVIVKGKLVPAMENGAQQDRTVLDRFLNPYGYWIVGIPFISSIHRFPIQKRRLNPNGKGLGSWVDLDPKAEMVSSLREVIAFPYEMASVVLSDGYVVNVLLSLTFRVVDPYLLVFEYKGGFFVPVSLDVEGPAADIIKTLDLNDFRAAPKGEIDGILEKLKDSDSRVNRLIRQKIGLELVGVSIPDFEAGNKATADALDAIANAERARQAQVIEARGYAEALGITTAADVKRKLEMARVSGIEITTAREALGEGVDPNVAATQAAGIIRTDDVAHSGIIAYSEGGGTPIPLAITPPVKPAPAKPEDGDDKKGEEKK